MAVARFLFLSPRENLSQFLFERFHSYRAKTWWNNPNHKIPCLHHNFQPIHGLGSINQSCQRDWSIELVGVFVTTQLYPKKRHVKFGSNLRLQTVGCETVCCDLAPTGTRWDGLAKIHWFAWWWLALLPWKLQKNKTCDCRSWWISKKRANNFKKMQQFWVSIFTFQVWALRIIKSWQL